mmetsp:Transcript_6696/g.19791  ORF Transcript_6696/g.19791 Transcript_6696/m.19791 type:complete len:243 (+) Transcript_6696:980-1708(+)
MAILNAVGLIFPAAAHHSSSVGSRPRDASRSSWRVWMRMASCVSVPSSISSVGVIRSHSSCISFVNAIKLSGTEALPLYMASELAFFLLLFVFSSPTPSIVPMDLPVRRSTKAIPSRCPRMRAVSRRAEKPGMVDERLYVDFFLEDFAEFAPGLVLLSVTMLAMEDEAISGPVSPEEEDALDFGKRGDTVRRGTLVEANLLGAFALARGARAALAFTGFTFFRPEGRRSLFGVTISISDSMF